MKKELKITGLPALLIIWWIALAVVIGSIDMWLWIVGLFS